MPEANPVSHSPDNRGKPLTRPQARELTLNGARALVFGLGRFGGGTGVTRFLAEKKARVTVTDQATEHDLKASIAEIAHLPVTLALGGHDSLQPADFDLVIVNPAVRKARSEFFQRIAESGVPWTTEINLFCALNPARVIGVTGTYGKSTSCAMLAAILGDHTRFGGNIGKSLLAELDDISPDERIVLELSDVQLADLPDVEFVPDAALVTNLSPHHLERYRDFTEYVGVKLNILGTGGAPTTVVAGPMHPEARTWFDRACANKGVTPREVNNDAPVPRLRVPGAHNVANARAAATLACALGVDPSTVHQALESFPGLEHRLQWLNGTCGLDVVNDSKSTAPSATVAAVESFDRPVVVIVGGQAAGDGDYTRLADCLSRCRAVIAVGESAESMAGAVRKACARQGRDMSHVEVVASLDAACDRALARARAGDVVLFSPGAPSYDRYANYRERGEHFIRLIAERS